MVWWTWLKGLVSGNPDLNDPHSNSMPYTTTLQPPGTLTVFKNPLGKLSTRAMAATRPPKGLITRRRAGERELKCVHVMASFVASSSARLGSLRTVAMESMHCRNLSVPRFVLHASKREAAEGDIDFSQLGLKYPVMHTPEYIIKRTSWSPPPVTPPQNLPFAVDRTQIGSSLPVYTDYKAGRTKVVTILRRCRGDIAQLRDEMEKVVGKPVTVRPGKLVVDGNYHARLKLWLAGLGF